MAAIRKRTWVTSKGERRVAWTVDFIDANDRRQRRQFSTRRAADAYRVDIESQMKAGAYRADATKVSVRDAAEMFLEHCDGRMRRNERMTRHNLAVYVGHVRNYICPDAGRDDRPGPPSRRTPFAGGIGALTLSQVTTAKVADFRDKLRESGVSVPTARKILGTLQLVLEHAIARDFLAVNPARGVKVIGRRDEGARKITPPSKTTMRRLIDAADPDFRTKLIFACATGVRAGELHALRWRHLDLAAAEVTIETRVDAYGEEDVTKTAAGMRADPDRERDGRGRGRGR